jgi:hypothetical protein
MATELTRIFTYAAIENIEETGADWSHDLDRLREGETTPEALLDFCLDGAGEDRVQGWRDYVDGLVAIIPVHDPEEEEACRGDWIHDSQRDDRATGDR